MPARKKRLVRIRQRQRRRAKRKAVHHLVTGKEGRSEPFTDLRKIMKEGFKARTTNWGNAVVKPPGRMGTEVAFWCKPSNLPHTFGDTYAIEMLAPVERSDFYKKKPLKPCECVEVRYAYPDQIKKIFIRINPNATDLERKRRIEFYRKEFPRTPIEFRPTESKDMYPKKN